MTHFCLSLSRSVFTETLTLWQTVGPADSQKTKRLGTTAHSGCLDSLMCDEAYSSVLGHNNN